MDINELRNKIDQIDKEMKELFIQRMGISKQIGQYKKEHHLNILDVKREEEIILNKKNEFESEELWPYYESFIRHLMDLSKEIQK